MITKDFTRQVLVKKLHQELVSWSPKVMGIMSPPDGTNFFQVVLYEKLTPQEDIELHKLVMEDHIPSSSLLDEKDLTDTRNKEGFDLYKMIFADISDNEPVTNIDAFITISDVLHKLRNFLKDGNFETAVRYMYKYVQPVATGEGGLFPLGFEKYRGWIKNIAIKYDSKMLIEMKDINPATIGTPVENMILVDYIEIAESV